MDDLVKRLRGQYAMGPHTPNGDPEFGWRQFESPPIQHEAADHIEALEAENARLLEELGQLDAPLDDRMAALGMVPMSTLLSEPPTSFSVHVGVNSLASFTDWLEKKNEGFLKMRMRYDVGIKPKDDEVFEWIFAHSAAFGQVCDHLRAALKGEGGAAEPQDETDRLIDATRRSDVGTIRALAPAAPAPVVPKVKPLVFDWTHQPTENPSEHITIGNGYSARVYIPYERGNDPASGVGTWCGVAQQRGQSGFPSRETATAYCEETIRDYAQATVNGASNFIDMAPVTVPEAARVLQNVDEEVLRYHLHEAYCDCVKGPDCPRCDDYVVGLHAVLRALIEQENGQ